MSVGAGSIKRAAKAVKSEVVGNPTEEVKAVVEKTAVAEKSTAPKIEAPKTTKKPVAKKTTTKKATTKSAAPKAETKKSAYNSGYVAYGVGQQLPVHLM